MTQESNFSEYIILFNNGDQVLSTHFWEEYLVHKNEKLWVLCSVFITRLFTYAPLPTYILLVLLHYVFSLLQWLFKKIDYTLVYSTEYSAGALPFWNGRALMTHCST